MMSNGKSNSPELDLGKRVEAPSHYTPSILRRIERSQERKNLPSGDKYPQFFGYDVWNAYEFNFLLKDGGPQNYILKIVYPASSPFIVESKSLKLYLGSYSMDRFEGIDRVLRQITSDLSDLLMTHVQVTATNVVGTFDFKFGLSCTDGVRALDVLAKDVPCTVFNHDASLLNPENIAPGLVNLGKEGIYQCVFFGLKSNCKVTHQPDYGQIFIKYRTRDLAPSSESLYKYLVSFRGENHFHEEIVETIYSDLLKVLPNATELVVFAQYTRRGGIDINPVRSLTLEGLEWLPCKTLLQSKPGEVRSFMQ